MVSKFYQDNLGMFLLGDMNCLHTQESCDLDFSNNQMLTLDILI